MELMCECFDLDPVAYLEELEHKAQRSDHHNKQSAME